MPIFELKDTNTNEVFEKFCSIKEYEEYMKENPHIQRHFSSMTMFIDEVKLGRKRPDGGWFDVLDKIKRNNPHHRMSDSRWQRAKEI